MRCPFCKNEGDKVVDSRTSGESIRRRRECLGCGRRFTTYEYIERVPLVVVKRDGKREDFRREKLEHGIRIACAKRPVPTEMVKEMVVDIENELSSAENSEVSYEQIGGLVMKKLSALDPVAYVRFASVYRRFKDAGEFMSEIKQIESDGDETPTGDSHE